MVQFTTIAAIVGMPMLVLASPLQPSRDVSALSSASHVKRAADNERVTAVDPSSNADSPRLSVTVSPVKGTPNPNTTPGNTDSKNPPSESVPPTATTTENPTGKTSGPLYAVKESATFSVYYLDPKDSKDPKDLKTKQVPVNYKDAAGPTRDNAGNAWFTGGFWQAIMSAGGSGVVKDGLFKSVDSSDDKLAQAGLWGFKYLTGVDAEKIDVTEDTKDWDALMDKANENPVIVLTKKPPAKGMEPNQYYTVYSTAVDKTHITVWNSTDPSSLQKTLFTVTSEELRKEVWELVYSLYKRGYQSFHGMVSIVNIGAPRRSFTERAGESAIPRTTPTIPFSPLSAPLLELTNVVSVDGLEERVNSRKLYRPRDGCGSVIRRAGLGRWVESLGHGLLQDPSSPFPASQAYWHVPNGPFEFEKIGFSRPMVDATLPQYAPGSCEKGMMK
ncbi:hypothetical protein L204_102713 [Cryptococcus depauperatus]